MSTPPPPAARDAAQHDLTAALRARDRVAVAALRSLLAALANAEAVSTETLPVTGEGPIAGGVVGLGGAEVERRVLDAAAIEGVVAAEVAERVDGAAGYRRAGAGARADQLDAEADVLRRWRSRHLD